MAADHIADILERLRALVGPVIEREGFELFDLELKPGRRGHLLRITIDVAGRESYDPPSQGGPAAVGIADCVRVTKALSPVLDVEDTISGAYTLEVSSPGVDRPLLTPAHFALAVGRRVRVKTRTPVAGESFFVVPLVEAGDDVIVLDVRGKNVEVPYRLISRASLEIEF